MRYQRLLDLPGLLRKKSFFLFGPRGTGKSFLIREQCSNEAMVLNLLRSDLLLRLTANPSEIESLIAAGETSKYIVIDEVQKVPALLNEVHRLIEEQQLRFLLTGSSARKLKRADVNLLAGRAWQAELFPLVSCEIPNFDLRRYIEFGGLPAVYQSNEPEEELYAYVNTYLKEEIQTEALVRKLPAFSRFLQIAAISNGQILNFTAIANDTGISANTIREYYQLLEDTFIGFKVPVWQKSIKRKPANTAKFYFFDLGVRNILAQVTTIDPNTEQFGLSLEHFIAMELRAFLSYKRIHKQLCYWRTTSKQEVDFIIGDEVAIEVKATTKVANKHCKGLRYLAEEKICSKYYLVTQDKFSRKEGEITMLPWQHFLQELWAGNILNYGFAEA